MKVDKIKNYYFTGSVLGSVGVTFFMPILYIYLSKKGYSLTELGFYLSVFWLVTFILEIPTGILADSLGQRRTLMISGFIRGLGLLLLLMNKNYGILLFSGILTGTAEALSSGSLRSWVVNKLKKEGHTENLQKLFAMIYSRYTLIFFMLHVFIILILEMKVGVYLHEELIKEDSLRSTMVSSFNTLESLFITMLLPISGKLSDKYSILESWKIIILSSVIVIFAIYLIYDRMIKKKDVFQRVCK
ncbi:MFS transporter [Fusobacteria bacterium ZRK30]|nr:MFS transporter [Fusobacteria bacterium ZRK30]